MHESTPITILMADDDVEDVMLTQDALAEARLANEFRSVGDGEALMDYLRREGGYQRPEDSPRPGLILLDLNMPKKNGFEALEEIKTDAGLRQIPIVVLTTSQAEEDVFRSYDLGVNSFISKPVTFEGLVDAMKVLGKYWIEIVHRPSDRY
jgi:CheY-like chemotaxis protein